MNACHEGGMPINDVRMSEAEQVSTPQGLAMGCQPKQCRALGQAKGSNPVRSQGRYGFPKPQYGTNTTIKLQLLHTSGRWDSRPLALHAFEQPAPAEVYRSPCLLEGAVERHECLLYRPLTACERLPNH